MVAVPNRARSRGLKNRADGSGYRWLEVFDKIGMNSACLNRVIGVIMKNCGFGFRFPKKIAHDWSWVLFPFHSFTFRISFVLGSNGSYKVKPSAICRPHSSRYQSLFITSNWSTNRESQAWYLGSLQDIRVNEKSVVLHEPASFSVERLGNVANLENVLEVSCFSLVFR